MGLRDFHIHTSFSDGANSPGEMAEAALRQGYEALGFSDHSYTAFDESYCMALGRASDYRQEIGRLKARYAGEMAVFCGVEQDGFSGEPTDGYDYVIGSLHYFRVGGEYVEVDGSPELLLAASEKHFGGDFLALTACYYDTLAERITRMKPDLIGHFDLIAKFNEGNALFDEGDEGYVRAWRTAADALLGLGVPFEVNTKMLCAARRSVPYPAPEICAYLAERGGRFVLSSDSHSVGELGGRCGELGVSFCDWRPV